MIDPVWAGVVGTAVGAVAGSAASLLAPLINWRTERQRLEVEKENAKELFDHQHALEVERIEKVSKTEALERQRELVGAWRDGVSEALSDYMAVHQSAAAETPEERQLRLNRGGQLVFKTVVGTPWFETLRPLLDTRFGHIVNSFIEPIEVVIGEREAKQLSDEITRIAREWNIFE